MQFILQDSLSISRKSIAEEKEGTNQKGVALDFKKFNGYNNQMKYVDLLKFYSRKPTEKKNIFYRTENIQYGLRYQQIIAVNYLWNDDVRNLF